jgi:hypothetical protein
MAERKLMEQQRILLLLYAVRGVVWIVKNYYTAAPTFRTSEAGS